MARTKNNKETKQTVTPAKGKRLNLKWRILPIALIMFIVLALWAGVWMGDVFVQVRENSFFAPSALLMHWELQQSLGWLWVAGRAMLMLFRWPLLGGAVLSIILTLCCYLSGYVLRLNARWRWIEWIPAGIYAFVFTYQGYNNWYQAESGHVFAIPMASLVVLAVAAAIIRIVTKAPLPALVRIPKDESALANALQLLIGLLMIGGAMYYGEKNRAYVRPTAQMQTAVMHADWDRVMEVADENSGMSVRPMAANYAIALVQKGLIADRLFDFRFDYETAFVQGYDGAGSPADMYDMECTYYAGLIEPAYHQAMNLMTMEGPSIRSLKMLCKTAMLRGEWTVAERYLDILDDVPFEGGFCALWRSYLNNPDLLNKNPEVAVIRNLEPMDDDLETNYQQPIYLSYNLMLRNPRSKSAMYNSMMVNLYSKTLPNVLNSLQQMQGTTPPKNIGEAVLMMSDRYHELLDAFPSLKNDVPILDSFYQQANPFLGNYDVCEANAPVLYPIFKGFYPYYYYFGNLKDTERKSTSDVSPDSGVN